MGRDLKNVVAAAATGDAEALKHLVELTQGRLYKFCLVLCGDPLKAEDLCQEAYVKAIGSLANLRESGAFMDWLFRLTRNLYIDELRKRREESAPPEEMDQHADQSPEITEILAVNKVLSQFEPEDRWLLVLVDMENYSYADAAGVLGITEDAVRSRLFRLRKAFIEKWPGPETKG